MTLRLNPGAIVNWRAPSMGVLFSLSALVFALCSPHSHAEYQLIDRVVAIVEDDIVLASEIRDRSDNLARLIRQRQGQVPDAATLYEAVLERAILDSLQLQRAERIGLRISDQELNDSLTRFANRQGMNLEQFREALEQRGQSYVLLREQEREKLLIQQLQRRSVLRGMSITDSEITNFLKSPEGQLLLEPQYQIDHVLLPISADASPAAVARAEQVVSRMRQQAQRAGGFATLLDEFTAASMQPSPLGWRRADEMPSIFTGLTEQLAVGEISEPVRSESGLHLIHIVAREGGVDGVTTETEVRHILVTPNEIRSDEEAGELAQSLAQRAKDGEDFAALARQYSDDPGSALAGGDLGWTEPGQLVPEFEQVMNGTEVGSTSEAFASQFGWHVLQVMDRREKDLSEQKAQQAARRAIAESKYEDELSNWLQELRDNAFVEIK